MTELDQQKIKVSTVSIHVMPLSSFKLGVFNNYPRLHTGVQVNRGDFSYLFDLEYGNNSLITPARSPYVYYGFRPEIQYHFVDYRRGSAYTGLEISYSYAERNVGRDNYFGTDGKLYRFDSALQKRVKMAAIIKLGGVREINEQLYLDFYFGFGRGIRNVAYLNQVNNTLSQIEPTEEWFSSSEGLNEGRQGIVVITMGCRVGYTIGN